MKKAKCKHPLNRVVPGGEFNQTLVCLACGEAVGSFTGRYRRPAVAKLPKLIVPSGRELNGIMALRTLLLQASDEIDQLRGAKLRLERGLKRVSLESMTICADACMLPDHRSLTRAYFAKSIHRSLGKIHRMIWEARGGIGPKPATGTKWSKE